MTRNPEAPFERTPKLRPGPAVAGARSLRGWMTVANHIGRQKRAVAPNREHGSGLYARRSIVTMRNIRGGGRVRWTSHGKYLQRDGANEARRGFDALERSVDITARMGAWHDAGDESHYRIMVSPDDSARIDMVSHVRRLMAAIENDLTNGRLEWMAIQHDDTDHRHVHVLLRGIDSKGAQLAISSQYAFTLSRRSAEIVERELGPRSMPEVIASREPAVNRLAWTEIDRAIERKLDGHTADYSRMPGLKGAALAFADQEMRRLAFLETEGLAHRVDEWRWELEPLVKPILKAAQRERFEEAERHVKRSLALNQGQGREIAP